MDGTLGTYVFISYSCWKVEHVCSESSVELQDIWSYEKWVFQLLVGTEVFIYLDGIVLKDAFSTLRYF